MWAPPLSDGTRCYEKRNGTASRRPTGDLRTYAATHQRWKRSGSVPAILALAPLGRKNAHICILNKVNFDMNSNVLEYVQMFGLSEFESEFGFRTPSIVRLLFLFVKLDNIHNLWKYVKTSI
jgi:hypothetical protein